IPSVHYHDFSIEDSPNENISLLFTRTNAIIDYAREHNERVLVHCHAGVSRSATVVLAYLVMRCGMSLKDAWEVTYRSRPIVRPNEGFAKML
ncbi:protein-tyrosine phosphatase-like protein, partial [Cladochytrium replicatum]